MINLIPQALAQYDLPSYEELEAQFPSIGTFKFKNSDLGEIISVLLPYLFVLAGLGIFGALIYSGFQLMTSGGDPKKTEQAKGCLTSAVIGGVIIFTSYWLIKIIQHLFGLGETF